MKCHIQLGAFVVGITTCAIGIHSGGSISSAAATLDEGAMHITAQTYAVSDQGELSLSLDIGVDLPEVPANTPPAATSPPPPTETTSPAPPLPTDAPQLDLTNATPPSPTAPTTTLPPPPKIEFKISSYPAINSRSEIHTILDGQRPLNAIDTVTYDLLPLATRTDAGSVAANIVTTVSSEISATTLHLPTPGLYPISISLQRDGHEVAYITTFVEMVRSDGAGRGPFRFELLAAAPQISPLPTTDEIEVARVELQRLIEMANAIAEPITISLPPLYLQHVVGNDADLLQKMRESFTGDYILGMPTFPLDPTAVADANLEALHAELQTQGTELLTAALPTSHIVSDVAVLPEAISVGGADVLDNIGVDLVVLTSDTYRTLDGNIGDFTDPSLLVNTDLGSGDVLRAAVLDKDTEYLNLPESMTAAEAAIAFMASASATRQQLDPDLRSLVLTTPDLGIANPAVIDHLEHFVAEHPDFTFEPLSSAADQTNTMFVNGNALLVEWPTIVDDRLIQRSAKAQRATEISLHVASMLPSNDPRPQVWSERLKLAHSTALSQSEADDLIEGVIDEVDNLRGAVRPPEPFPFTLTGSNGQLHIQIENTSPTPLTVAIHLQADRLLPMPEPMTFELQPNVINDIRIPVKARANGNTTVGIEVRTPTGIVLFKPLQMNGRINAFSGVGRAITAGALLALGSWWYTYIRRHHRQRQANR